MISVDNFIVKFRNVFGDRTQLPNVFWFSDTPADPLYKFKGCFFKAFKDVHRGSTVSVNVRNISCNEGKFYANNNEIPEKSCLFNIFTNYSTQNSVVDFLVKLGFTKIEKSYVNFARVDTIKDFSQVKGLLFFSTEEFFVKLASWACHDNQSEDTITTLYEFGCCTLVKKAILENKENGNKTFVNLLDEPIRNLFLPNTLCYTIPMSRFKKMYQTLMDNNSFELPKSIKLRQKINDFYLQKFLNPVRIKEQTEVFEYSLKNLKFNYNKSFISKM